MSEAVAAEAFGELSALAGAAELLGPIVERLRGGDGPSFVATPERLTPDGSAEKVRLVSRGQKYPQYFREADRLVKRAWSKKEKQPYEHKAPREIVGLLLKAIQEHKGHRQPFEVADILPLHRSNGEEYPSYQSYLALGWLRHAGAVTKGRNGYSLQAGWDQQRVNELWDRLPSVA